MKRAEAGVGGVTGWNFDITMPGSRTHLACHWEWGRREERSRGGVLGIGKEQKDRSVEKYEGGSDTPGRGATPSPLGGVLPAGAGSADSRTLGSRPRVLAASMPLTLRAWRLPL